MSAVVDADHEEPQVPRAARELIDPRAGRPTLDELPQLLEHEHEAAGEHPLLALGPGRQVGLAAALDVAREVLGQREQDSGADLLGHAGVSNTTSGASSRSTVVGRSRRAP